MFATSEHRPLFKTKDVADMHMGRERAAQLGQEAGRILRAGAYTAPSGRAIALQAGIARAVAGTRSYSPDAVLPMAAVGQHETAITVTNESTW